MQIHTCNIQINKALTKAKKLLLAFLAPSIPPWKPGHELTARPQTQQLERGQARSHTAGAQVISLGLRHAGETRCTCVLSHFICVQLFVTPWTIAHQVPLSMGFSRQEYWSG